MGEDRIPASEHNTLCVFSEVSRIKVNGTYSPGSKRRIAAPISGILPHMAPPIRTITGCLNGQTQQCLLLWSTVSGQASSPLDAAGLSILGEDALACCMPACLPSLIPDATACSFFSTPSTCSWTRRAAAGSTQTSEEHVDSPGLTGRWCYVVQAQRLCGPIPVHRPGEPCHTALRLLFASQLSTRTITKAQEKQMLGRVQAEHLLNPYFSADTHLGPKHMQRLAR